MLIRPNIVNMFHELNAEFFDGDIPTIPVVWNNRMTTTAGYCRYTTTRNGWDQNVEPRQLDLSDKLFRNCDYDEDKIRRTLVHEMVHAYIAHIHNETGHNWRFQQMMRDITGEWKNHRCHSYDTKGLRRKQAKKIKCVCSWCGAEWRKVRMPKYAGRLTYSHRNCGGPVVFTLDPNGTEEAQASGRIKIF
jgi:predicted SprT family Zn-dependent metalloprotease